jgi:hypothetical protein
MRLSRPALLVAAAFTAALTVTPSALAKPVAKAAAPMTSTTTQQCAVAQSSAVFAPWGDSNLYAPFQGSTFEDAVSGWSFAGGAGILSGDDDGLLTATGSHVVQIPSKGTATSPSMCVDSTMPSMRFFIRRLAGTGSLTITGTLTGGKASDREVLATLAGSTSWAPTPVVAFPAYLADIVGIGSLNVQFLFTASPGTTFRIDDVQMDPYRRT